MSQSRWILPFAVVAGCLMCSVGFADTSALTRDVTLQWTAPGDDGWVGKPAMYEIRWSMSPITQDNWLEAPRVNTWVVPGVAGTSQTATIVNLLSDQDYYFVVRTMDEAGNWSTISNLAYAPANAPATAALRSQASGPARLTLAFAAPRPNPARGAAQFAVTLPSSSWLRVEAFDVNGRVVRTIAKGEYSAGAFDLRWDLRDDNGRALDPGVYLVRGQLGESVFTRRVTVVR